MKLKIFILFGFITILSALVFAQVFFRGETLSSSKVKEKWGHSSLDFNKFKDGDLSVKAKMAYEIMLNKNLIGKSVFEIRELFGSPDGFYFIDAYPAYLIQDGSQKNQDSWQIVLRLNERSKVRDIIVHKNCCDR